MKSTSLIFKGTMQVRAIVLLCRRVTVTRERLGAPDLAAGAAAHCDDAG